jgi:hypothetical protein
MCTTGHRTGRHGTKDGAPEGRPDDLEQGRDDAKEH